MSGISAVGSGSATRAFQPPSFSKLDSDSSGGITLDELKSNTPGGVSSSQSDAHAEKLFAALDSDGNGSVSETEKNTFDTEQRDSQSAAGFAAQQLGGGRPPPPNSDDIVSALDSDGNGGVSFDELSSSEVSEGIDDSALAELFATIDSDGDEAISSEEIASFLEANKPEGGPGGGGGPGGPGGAGGPPPPPPPSEEDEDSTASTVLDALTQAIKAYETGTTSEDALVSNLLDLLDEAA